MGYAGLKNGKLLEMAEAAGFDILITGDKTLQYEQNMQGRKIALVSLSAVGWRSLNHMFRRL
jgi:putative NIF3 family GTP cyclohydrolase 1 type 2